jgi:nitrogen fixation NifU-like protein
MSDLRELYQQLIIDHSKKPRNFVKLEKGKNKDETQVLFERFHALVTGDGTGDPSDLGKLAVFSGVREFPVRVKCATLPWHTMRAALEGRGETISTE